MTRDTFDLLREMITHTTCKPGWRFEFTDDDEGFRLRILVPVDDSRGGFLKGVYHFFPVPLTTWNEKSWRRWVFECCRQVEDHELGEWFVVKGVRPFSPLHGPGNNPYMVRELSTQEEVDTDQSGRRVEGSGPANG